MNDKQQKSTADAHSPSPVVYEAQLVEDSPTPTTAIQKKEENHLTQKSAYKIGKAVGTTIAAIGFLNKLTGWFRFNPTPNHTPSNTCNGTGKGSGKGFGKRRGKGRWKSRDKKR